MERETGTLSITQLRAEFVDIDFPEYQREPTVWSREQKQRLLDSILRSFDIAPIYLYRREDGTQECIDGRQRLNAIMSFLGENPSDEVDNGFPLRSANEISTGTENPYQELDGLRYEELSNSDEPLAVSAVAELLAYRIAAVYLSDVTNSDEFNLQFLRLNLGTLINAGEKLNAMVGGMREFLFSSDRVGLHPFFASVNIPTRRFARQQTAAQTVLQIFALEETNEFTRARHFDLQRFVKEHEGIGEGHPRMERIALTFDSLEAALGDTSEGLRNRAMTVSVALLAWTRALHENEHLHEPFKAFVDAFLATLEWQVGNMKEFEVDERYRYLVEFQRHVTQASVEKPAVTHRHAVLDREFTRWLDTGQLTGDEDYLAAEGELPAGR